MSPTHSKAIQKSDQFEFSDESQEYLVPEKDLQQFYEGDPLIMMDEDLEGESLNESSTKVQKEQQRKKSRHEDNHFQDDIKSEDNSSPMFSSLMDLEDVCSFEEKNQGFDFQDESQWLDLYLSKNKQKKKAEKKKKTQNNEANLVKIENKRNRKIRTTISEEKIKIMEYLFPFVLSAKPYKGSVLSLKDVAKIVDLGYSTVLHKYKDFRNVGQIQKGLLLKCKDFKRKYNKSLIIENYIKKALKEGEFKTAKQLAIFISEKYNINVNRSIISRHLNEMQREKIKIDDKKVQISGKKKPNSVFDDVLQKLKEFCLVFLGLKKQKVSFYYFSVIRLYLAEGRLSFFLKSQEANFNVINLSIIATETKLQDYYPYFVNETDIVLAKNLRNLNSFAYKLLYHQLESHAEGDQLDIERDSNYEKAYVIFPYKNTLKESQYRHKKLDDLMKKKISVLTIPPEFKLKNINFIKYWFIEEVMLELEDMEFESLTHCKESILTTMNSKQAALQTHSNRMISSFKNF